MNLCVVISGSFRKHLDAIGLAMKNFQTLDIIVLAPSTMNKQESRTDFILLETDDTLKPADQIENEFLSKIKQANFLYVANIDGYIGKSVATEIGVALLNHIPIILAEKIQIISEEVPECIQNLFRKLELAQLAIDQIRKENINTESLSPVEKNYFSTDEMDSMHLMLDRLIEELKHQGETMSRLHLPEHPTLQDFQTYVEDMTHERGFDSESISEIFMLLSEECGELAKAARKTQRIKTDANSESFHIDHEAADVFIYLLDICNHFHIDLEKAFREKEEINKKRVWK